MLPTTRISAMATLVLLGSSIAPVDADITRIGLLPSIVEAAQCLDNPQDYNLSYDIQITFQNDVGLTCNPEQISAITAGIERILDQDFATTVLDWAGQASFTNAHLDGKVDNMGNRRQLQGQPQRQLSSTCPTSRSDLFVDCTADVCRFGCVTAQTTMCGAPLLANWDKLGDVIKEMLAGLGLQCLGVADLLEVDVVVDEPGTEEVRAFPVSKEPKEETDEEDRAVASVQRPVRPAASVGPSSGNGGATATVARPTSGTGSGTVASVARPSTGAASGNTQAAAAATQTTNSNTGSSNRNTDVCVDNAIVYNVALDIQVDSPTSDSCSNGQWNQIKSKAQQALNNNVEDEVWWDGYIGFGSLAIDDSQTIQKRRRQLRGLEEEELEQVLPQQQGHRQLSTCPMQRDITCNADTCYWGCMIAPTTSCGINALTSWSVLEDFVRDELVGLGYGCLGNTNNLVVNLLVEEPTMMGTRAFDINSATATDASNENKGVSERKSLDRSAVIDTSNRLIEIKSQIFVTFFANMGAMPDTAAIANAENALYTFFEQQFLQDPEFKTVFKNFYMTDIKPQYDFANPQEFVLNFLATVGVDPNAPAQFSTRKAANIMANANFRQLIGDYLRGQGGEFDNTFKVRFRGVAHGHGG